MRPEPEGLAASRPPLVTQALLQPAGSRWRVRAVAETASTNAELLAAADQGAAEGAVLVAEYQHAGVGRLGRSWSSPAGAGLTMSVLLRPAVPPSRWGWLPLLAGVACVEAVAGGAVLKWPNDVLIQGGKVAGILVQSQQNAVVIGIGVNVSTQAAELADLPSGSVAATSLWLAGAPVVDRARLLTSVLRQIDRHYDAWQQADGDAEVSGLAERYRLHCSTLGQSVRVELPNSVQTGTVAEIDSVGRIVLDTGSEQIAVAAGDVTHLRTGRI